MNKANKNSIKNALAYLSSTVLNKKRLRKLMFQNPSFLQRLYATMEKQTFKAVHLVAAFIHAKAYLRQDEIQRLYSYFRQACRQKIKFQQERLSSNENDRLRYINVIQKCAEYMVQLIGAPILTEGFIIEILAFIFQSNNEQGLGKDGRIKRQYDKIASSLSHLREEFTDFIRQTETGMQTGVGHLEEQLEKPTGVFQQLEQLEEEEFGKPGELLGSPQSMELIEDISIFFGEREEEDQIWSF